MKTKIGKAPKTMIVFELYKKCTARLEKDGIDDASLDARLLVECACGISHGEFLLKRDRQASDEEVSKAEIYTEKRLSGKPVQYITGKWEFLDMEFSVGEGVLIPRPETEELVMYAFEKIKNMKKPVVFDLCSGSGCIGLSIKNLCPDADVYMVEKSDEALRFLEKNRIDLGFGNNTVLVKGDILKGYEGFAFLPKPDVIISNPPYIKTAEIATLQKEVQNEPHMALDGGEDGYIFYRCLSEKWLPFINDGGFMAVECGEEQAVDIAAMFSENAAETEIINDFNGTERMVSAFR